METAAAPVIFVAQLVHIAAAAAKLPLEIAHIPTYLLTVPVEEPRATSVKVLDSAIVAASMSSSPIKEKSTLSPMLILCFHHRSGYCGSTTAHCTAGSGCQASFGICTTSDLSPDGTCGGSNGYKCKGSGFGKSIMFQNAALSFG
jgi:hypothetical protein